MTLGIIWEIFWYNKAEFLANTMEKLLAAEVCCNTFIFSLDPLT